MILSLWCVLLKSESQFNGKKIKDFLKYIM
jgi:hypothetical protein